MVFTSSSLNVEFSTNDWKIHLNEILINKRIIDIQGTNERMNNEIETNQVKVRIC